MKRLIPLILLLSVMLLAGPPADASYGPGGGLHATLLADQTIPAGEVKIYNTRESLRVEATTQDGWLIKEIHIFAGDSATVIPMTKDNNPIPGQFPFKMVYDTPRASHLQEISFLTLGFSWGSPYQVERLQKVAVHADLVQFNAKGKIVAAEGAWAYNEEYSIEFPGSSWDWYTQYEMAHPRRGHFVDVPVKGLTCETDTARGLTDDSGGFDYFAGEQVEFFAGNLPLGSAVGDSQVTPIDLFEGSNLDDIRVLNVARLLQTLDADVNPAKIDITPNLYCLGEVSSPVDFGNDVVDVPALFTAIRTACPDLVEVSKDLAQANLAQGQKAANILKTNVSKAPEAKSDKAKIEIMPVYVPAQTADGTSTTVVYHDDAGSEIETRGEAKPVLVVYQEEVVGTGASDIFVAISRDDGSTWKRTNISKTAGKASTKVPAYAHPGDSKKPMMSVKDNMIFVAWTDKYCQGGRPAYAITTAADLNCNLDGDFTYEGVLRTTDEGGEQCVPDYPGDDAYWQDDLYGVGGPQRSVLYDPVDWPEMGEVPYSCVWTARGWIEPLTGIIVWLKPERVTSGRRDANQLTSAAADDAGVAIAWQEDPKGLQPPDEYGPGDGWSGANTSNKTDIWYSFIRWSDFAKIDPDYVPFDNGEGSDIVDTDDLAEDGLAGRAKALVPMSLPVKITDNDVCSLENMAAEGGDGDHEDALTDETSPNGAGEGTHRYCGELQTDPDDGSLILVPGTGVCASTVAITKTNHETGEVSIHNVCVTADNIATSVDERRVLDGNTGASRPNLFLQTYTIKADNPETPDVDETVKSAWAILAYEESKGVGSPPEVEGEDDEDRYKPDLGKNVIYHSFDYTMPEKVSGGGIINLSETDGSGSPVYVVDEFGAPILDPLERPQLAYENARRVRLLQQPKAKAIAAVPVGPVLVALYRQGEEGKGKAADVFMRRMSAFDLTSGKSTTGNPYAFKNFLMEAQNLSSVTPGETRTYDGVTDLATGEPTTITKMVNWTWNSGNLSDKSGTEPYSDALAHRGAINGNELIIAYSWTPNWGRLANDKYDLYVRRSWDGGQSWRTDPKSTDPIEHIIRFVDPDTKEETLTYSSYGPGALEPPRNISNLRNNRVSVLEPRLVKTPGTIKRTDGGTPYSEDTQNPYIFQVAWGLEFNDFNSDLDPEGEGTKMPLDIYYGRTTDKGQHYETVFGPNSDGTDGSGEDGWNLLAKDKAAQFGAQVKQTPDGSRMYAVWVEEGESGSDVMFRRIDYRPPAMETVIAE